MKSRRFFMLKPALVFSVVFSLTALPALMILVISLGDAIFWLFVAWGVQANGRISHLHSNWAISPCDSRVFAPCPE